MVDFPRVLFITPVAFNPYAGGGATFASLFHGWPKDRLATVHNDRAISPNDTCEKYFFLEPQELDLAPPFNLLRRRSSEALPNHRAASNTPAYPQWIHTIRHKVLGDSIPECARLSDRLAKWIAEYNPEVIYTILGSNGMMSLIEKIRTRFGLPLVLHIMDDWANSAHRKGLFATLERYRMERHIVHFFDVAIARLGISAAMCDAYESRYRRAFIPFQYALDIERWRTARKSSLKTREIPELLYAGSIFPNAQLNSLIDCTRAVAALNEEGTPLRLRIATSSSNIARFGSLFATHPNVVLDDSNPDDSDFFQGLADADALLLPVNFDEASINFIRYSMPTKVPAYLNSGSPILAYGPVSTAQIGYAHSSGWGLVIGERSHELLKNGLKQIMQDDGLRRTLSAAAINTAANHDARTVREAFQSLLSQASRQQL